MNRRLTRFGAVAGAAALSLLAASPSYAATVVSQATAQSIDLHIGGSSVVSQQITATNDGQTETRNDASTVPTLADLLTGNNALGAGVAPQDAHANSNGTSFACAGLAGTGGGIAYVGHSACDVDKGQVLTLNLGSLDLDLVTILGSEGAITGPLADALRPLTLPVGTALDDLVAQLAGGLADTPLGQISLQGALSTIEADCTANPAAATGGAEILDSSGDRQIPIRATVPTAGGGTQTLDLADLDVDLEPRPGGYNLLLDLDKISQAVIDAVEGEVQTALGGAISGLNNPLLETLLDNTVQAQILAPIVAQLHDTLLQQLSDNILRVVVLDRTFGDSGRSVDVTALRAEVLPAAAQFAGSALIDGTVGHVTCGPNQLRTQTPPATNPPGAGPAATPQELPDIPTSIDSGRGGDDNTAKIALLGTGAVALLAGTVGLLTYRRKLLGG